METNMVEPPKEPTQGMINSMTLPINADHLAVGRAIGELLKEGWEWVGLAKREDSYFIVLRREWRA